MCSQNKGSVEEIDDTAQYQVVRAAMTTIELTEEEQDDIFAIVASVLHMGNVGMTEDDSKAIVSKRESVDTIAKVRKKDI